MIKINEMRNLKKIIILVTIIIMSLALAGCASDPVGEQFSADGSSSSGNTNGNTSYEALFYTNNGELYSIVEGKNFSFTSSNASY